MASGAAWPFTFRGPRNVLIACYAEGTAPTSINGCFRPTDQRLLGDESAPDLAVKGGVPVHAAGGSLEDDRAAG
jgi:hypothetical protein